MIDFPNSPSVGQIFNSGTGPVYIWDGVAWSLVTTPFVPTWEPIAKIDQTNVATVNIPNLAGFDLLRFTGEAYLSNAGAFGYRTSTNNGSSYDNGASDYNNQAQQISAATVSAANANGTFAVNTNTAWDIGVCVGFSGWIADFGKRATVSRGVMVSHGVTSGNALGTIFWNTRAQNTARNAIQFLPGAGTFLAISMLIEGVR